ncbi:probable E3 ubiquitin-protein ligase ARI7 [Denticeps clupeoides]|nr:probable E3 ubiquitin-protein ligase ARI7 [Denticeps clupeoides]
MGDDENPVKYVNRRDEITLDDDPDVKRMEMSCGHAVSSQSLTSWCRSLLDQGQYKFTCPALVNDTSRQCGAPWTYEEVRRVALFTDEEQNFFEETLARNAAFEYCEYKSCPGCQTYVERQDLTNLCVHCTVCTALKNQTFYFCWQCLQKWKGPGPRQDRCDNEGCVNPDVQKLQNCANLLLPQVQNAVCPSMRACPTCGRLVEHNGTGCKNIICPRCQKEFCFICLKLTKECLKTSRHFTPCPGGVKPCQTSIPVWRK